MITVESSRRMVGTLKHFDSHEHSVYDLKGKQAMLNFLKSQDVDAVENPNKYGIDLLSLKDGKVSSCWEIEVRHGNWRGNVPFPFDKINCIERKEYLWRKDDELASKIPFPLADPLSVYYVQLNNECNRAVIIDGKVVLEYPLVPWANRKANGEYVRQVPINRCTQIKLT